MKPQRIQRKRTKGWKMPEGVVYVGRPSWFGNPFDFCEGRTPEQAVKMFRAYAMHEDIKVRALAELRGKDLACWCPLDQPCHADVLIETANEGGSYGS